MLDDLKKEQQAGLLARERIKLSLYVGGMLLMGAVIYMGASSRKIQEGGTQAISERKEEEKEAPPPPPELDPAEMQRLVAASGDEPNRWSAAAIEYVRRIRRTGRLPAVSGRVGPDGLWALEPAEARGRALDLVGKVVAVSREAYGATPGDDSGRLWSVIVEGEDGKRAVALSYALRSEFAEGPPTDTRPPAVRGERIEPGHHIIARGIYLQRRTGTLGGTQLEAGTPALFALHYRIVVAPDQRNPLISGLDEALWSEVHDRFNKESRAWDEDALFEVIQWARAQGYDACRDAVLHGDVGWQSWGRERFKAWKEEVRVGADDPRPLTEASRGKVFRLSGIVGEVLDFGWERIPRNPWGVDEFQAVSLLADHYRNVALRVFLPFPIETFPGVKGERAEHIRIYGVFVKNLTYDTRFKSEEDSDEAHPVTVPMFVVLHAEPYPEDIAQKRMRAAMVWVAAGMLLFGFLFYFVLIRGGRRQNKEMDAHRLAIRRRVRERGRRAAPAAPSGDDEETPAGPEDGEGAGP